MSSTIDARWLSLVNLLDLLDKFSLKTVWVEDDDVEYLPAFLLRHPKRNVKRSKKV